MQLEMSRREVIVCRGIWYAMTLLSLFGLYISLNLLWPPGGKSPALSRFLRDGAVSVTTFYAVTVLSYLLFTDTPSSNCYNDFTTEKERISQFVFAELALVALLISTILYSGLVDHDVSFVLYMSLFTISLFIGGTGLIQLSDKFRMEMKHAYITLLGGCLCWFFGIYFFIYGGNNSVVSIITILVYNICLPLLYILGQDMHLAQDMRGEYNDIYAVTVLRYLLFSDSPSTYSYKDFTTKKERIPQFVFAELACGVIDTTILFSGLVDYDVSFVKMTYRLLR